MEGREANILYLFGVRADRGSDGIVRLSYFMAKAGRTAGTRRFKRTESDEDR